MTEKLQSDEHDSERQYIKWINDQREKLKADGFKFYIDQCNTPAGGAKILAKADILEQDGMEVRILYARNLIDLWVRVQTR